MRTLVGRIALLSALAAAAVALPAAAPGAGCSPLNCAPSGTDLGGGLLAARPTGISGPVQVVDLKAGAIRSRLPAGVLAGRVLVAQSASNELTWYDASTAGVTGRVKVQAAGPWSLVGAAQDGSRAVLLNASKKGESTFVVVSPAREQSLTVTTGTGWDFDALAGNNLYLLRYLSSGYEVRRYDLAADKLIERPLKDPNGSSTIWGAPWARSSSADGRYLFTLFMARNGGAMVHILDLNSALARCADLPGSNDFAAATTWAMNASPDGKTLWAVNAAYGRAVGIDVAQARPRIAFRFRGTPLYANGPTSSVSAISPDGTRIAIAAGGKVFYVSLARRVVTRGPSRAVVALGYAPDGATLWAVGKSEQVTALPRS